MKTSVGSAAPSLGAIDEDGGRDQGHPGGVDDQEQDLIVARGVLLGVERLQLLHGLEAERGRGVVEPEHVGGEVHHHRAVRRVTLGHAGEESHQQRLERAAEQVDRAAALAELHDAEPEAHDSGQAERDLEGGLGEIEGGPDHLGPHASGAEGERPDRSDGEGDQEEAAPDAIQHVDRAAARTSPCRAGSKARSASAARRRSPATPRRRRTARCGRDGRCRPPRCALRASRRRRAPC